MITARLEQLTWERIYLRLKVSVSQAEPDLREDALCFYICRAEDGRCVGLPDQRRMDASGYEVRINITNRGDERAYSSGSYALALCRRDGTFLGYAQPGASGQEAQLYRSFPYQRDRGLEVSVTKEPAFLHIKERKGRMLPRLLSGAKYAFLQLYYNLLSLLSSSGRSRRILFISEMNPTISGNMEAVKKRLLARGLDQKYTLLESARNSRGKSDTSLLKVLAKMAQSGIIIADDHVPFLDRINPGKDRRLIQLWHAGVGFKATGYSRWGHQGAIGPMSGHRRITYGITASARTVGIFSELWGIADERVIPCGLPRMDRLFDEKEKREAVRRLKQRYPVCEGKRVVLFAPTYRGKGRRDANYPMERLDFAKWSQRAKAGGYVVLVKMHPWISVKDAVPAGLQEVICQVDPAEDTGDLMLLADLLVTDYSSVIFEFAALRKPMVFYAFDEKEYGEERGFHRPYRENAPGPVAKDFDRLLELLDQPQELQVVEAYAAAHFDDTDGGASDRVIDWLIEGELPEKYSSAIAAYEQRTREWKSLRFGKT